MMTLEWISPKEWFSALEGIDIVLIAGILLLLAGYIYLIIKVTRLEFVGGLVGKRVIRVFGILFSSIVVVYLLYNVHNIQPNQWLEISLLAGLVGATGFLALVTLQQAHTTAKEMKEQRVMASRPFIIQRAEQKKAFATAITTSYFSHFEIYNAGNGPAIELETSLLNEEKSLLLSERESYLRTGESVKLLPIDFGKEQPVPDIEPPVKLVPIHLIAREKRAYLVSEYQNIFSDRQNPTWYQTWLPFEASKASKEGEIYVKPGELEFREVHKKDRIDAFGSKSKPK